MSLKKLAFLITVQTFIEALLFNAPPALAMKKREFPGEETKERGLNKKKDVKSPDSIASQTQENLVVATNSNPQPQEVLIKKESEKNEEAQLIKIKNSSVAPQNRPNAIMTQRLVIAPTYPEDVRTIFEKKLIEKTSSNHEQRYLQRRQAFQCCPDIEVLKITDYSVFFKETGELIGKFNFLVNVFQGEGCNAEYNNTVFTDIGLVPNFQRRGYGTELLTAVSEQVIRPLLGSHPMIYLIQFDGQTINMATGEFPAKLSEVYAKIEGSNLASLALHKKCGWQFLRKDEDYNIFFYVLK